MPMPLKESGWSKLPQLVPNHVFRHEDRNKLLTVMDRERVSDHIWNHGGPPRPGLNNLSIFVLIHPVHFLEQMVVDECAFTD
jgi:hypothetical protein